jgi:hypothetical protein
LRIITEPPFLLLLRFTSHDLLIGIWNDYIFFK